MSARPRPSTIPSGPTRGFTLIEVLVALSAGVLVSIATFMLSKSATAFFQREARISSAQLALTLAMNRLTGDIQRASYLSTANSLVDPNVCRTTSASWPTGLGLLTGVTITSGAATPQGAIQNPPMAPPDQIIIGGSMDSAEVYQVQSIAAGAGNAPLLTMRSPTTEPATYRALATLGTPDTLASRLTPVFYPNTYPTPPVSSGRFGHLYHPASNFHTFGVIDSFTVDPVSGAIKVQLLATPTLPVQGTSTCGIAFGDTGGGWLFSVVTRAQYSIQSIVAAPPVQLAQIVTPPTPQQALVTGDLGRTELVRTELDASNLPIAASTELVAEYAVDLRFGITVSSLITGYNYNPTVTSYAVQRRQRVRHLRRHAPAHPAASRCAWPPGRALLIATPISRRAPTGGGSASSSTPRSSPAYAARPHQLRQRGAAQPGVVPLW